MISGWGSSRSKASAGFGGSVFDARVGVDGVVHEHAVRASYSVVRKVPLVAVAR